MAFRNLVIESPAYVSVRNSQLIVRTDTEHSVAIEDISAILLESRQSTVTTAALSQLGQRGCAVFVCDEKHMPCAVLTPYQQYVRGLTVLRDQLAMSEPRKKRLWQQIAQEKIRNQAICLQLARAEEQAKCLLDLIAAVRSGDADNVVISCSVALRRRTSRSGASSCRFFERETCKNPQYRRIFARKNRPEPCLRAVLLIVYYTIPRTIREL